jgi:hypothetical protein
VDAPGTTRGTAERGRSAARAASGPGGVSRRRTQAARVLLVVRCRPDVLVVPEARAAVRRTGLHAPPALEPVAVVALRAGGQPGPAAAAPVSRGTVDRTAVRGLERAGDLRRRWTGRAVPAPRAQTATSVVIAAPDATGAPLDRARYAGRAGPLGVGRAVGVRQLVVPAGDPTARSSRHGSWARGAKVRPSLNCQRT